MFDLQARFIFPRHAVSESGPCPKGAEYLTLVAEDGVKLSGVHIPPVRRHPGCELVMAFPGNAWNAQDAAEYLHELFPTADVVSFFYRGYRPSGGKPSARRLIADAPAVFDFAVDRFKPDRTVAVGFSIGTGIAANLAAQRPVDGLILVTPFDSLKAVAQDMVPMLPIGPIFAHDIESADVLADCDVPVAILAGGRDAIVKPARTDYLRSKVKNCAYDRTIDRAGHNDIYARSEFQLAMRDAMDALVG